MEIETTDKEIRELLLDFHHGAIVLPQFQRDYVWKASKIRNLLDSLLRGLPIGAFYLWLPPEGRDFEIKPKPFGTRQDSSRFRGYLIDGQQRLTSLEAAYNLFGGRDNRGDELRCFLDLAASDSHQARDTRLFVTYAQNRTVTRRTQSADPTLIELTRLLEGKDFELIQDIESQLRSLPGWDEKRVSQARRRLERALDMLKQRVPCVTIYRATREEAIELFRRLNRGGVPLRQADVHAAELVLRHASHVLAEMRRFVQQDRPQRLGFGFSSALRALVLFHLGTTKFGSLPSDWVDRPGPKGRTLADSWKASEQALDRALEFADLQLGWSRRSLLPSVNALILLAAALAKTGWNSDAVSLPAIRRWLCLTGLRGTFQSSVETKLTRFHRAIERSKGNAMDALLGALSRAEGGKIRPEELLQPAHPWGNATQIMYAWLFSQQARDWIYEDLLANLANVSSTVSPFGDLTVHHIFPRHLVGKLMGDPNRANILSNYALVSRATNSSLKDKPPAEALSLLGPEQQERASVQYFGSEAGDMLEPDPDKCSEFWEWRAKRLAKAINEWLGLG